MRVCFPVSHPEGLKSRVYEHFGSAPAFVVVDTESDTWETVPNRDVHHRHGQCRPVRALGTQAVDAVVVSSIGPGALAGLTRYGIRVYQARPGTVEENLRLWKDGQLSEWDPTTACAGHGGAGHAHRHRHMCAHGKP